MLIREFSAGRRSHHSTVIVHEFADRATSRESRQPSEVDSCFCVTCSAKHTTSYSSERKHVPRPRDVAGISGRVDENSNRVRAISCRNSGSDAVTRINAH